MHDDVSQETSIARDTAPTPDLAATVAALAAQMIELRQQNALLQQKLATLETHGVAGTAAPRALTVTSKGTISRRGVLQKAMGAAAATAGAAALLETTKGPAAAADGQAIIQGQAFKAIDTEQTSTELHYNGVSPLRGVMFLSNDSSFTAAAASYPATLGGWAGNLSARVPNGIYGFTSVAGGNAVVGYDASAAATGALGTGKGVFAASNTGTGLYGTSFSTVANATAIIGVIASTSPGASSTAVRGQNNGTGALGIGVYGSQAGSGWGVFGTAPRGLGVYGNTSTGTGVYGLSSSGTGVYGTSSTGTGVVGVSASTLGSAMAVYGLISSASPGGFSAAVRGQNNGTGGNGIGVWGSQAGSGWGGYFTSISGIGVNVSGGSGTGVFSSSSSGTGVAATSSSGTAVNASSGSGTAVNGSSGSTAGFATAINGVISSTSPGGFSAAVRGQNNGTGGNGIGVYGSQAGSGWGGYFTSVSGIGVNVSGGSGTGVNATSGSGTGVSASSSSGTAVFASSGSGTAVNGTSGSTAASATAINGVISSTSPGGFSAAVRGQNNGTGGLGIGVYGSQAGSGWGVYGTSGSGGFAVFAGGNFAATGTKSALVPAEDGNHRTLYCMESPECWFEDFGAAQLVGGSARVQIDPVFAATVRTDEYHIFLTPQGDSKGLFVSGVDAAGFTVREQQAGRSTLPFSYRVVGKRKDVVAQRLASVRLELPPQAPAITTPPVSAQQGAPRPETQQTTQVVVPQQQMTSPSAPAVEMPAILQQAPTPVPTEPQRTQG
jgi:hypothetical protein